MNKYINQILANAKEYLNESNTTPLCLLLNVFFFSNFKTTTMKMKMKKTIGNNLDSSLESLTSSFEGSLIQKKTEEVCMYMQVWSRVVFLWLQSIS